MTYQFIAVYNEYCVALMCSVLEVSVSGYYAWRKREPSRHRREDAFLAEKIVEAFQHNRRVYGSPRLHYEREDDQNLLLRQACTCGNSMGKFTHDLLSPKGSLSEKLPTKRRMAFQTSPRTDMVSLLALYPVCIFCRCRY
jgi:hypothetical protein